MMKAKFLATRSLLANILVILAMARLMAQSPVSEPPGGLPLAQPAPTQNVAAPSLAQPSSAIRWRGNDYDVFFADLESDSISLRWKNRQGNPLSGLEAAAREVELDPARRFLLATNAGMFHADHTPVGLYVEKGEVLIPLNRESGAPGNFYLEPNGVFYIRKNGLAGVMETGAFAAAFPGSDHGGALELATQSGPMLVSGGKLHPAFRENSPNLHIRSGVGVSGGRTVILAISREPVNFHAFATLFRDLLRCRDALFLDGAISRFHAPELGLNNPGGSFGGILVVSEKRNADEAQPAGVPTRN